MYRDNTNFTFTRDWLGSRRRQFEISSKPTGSIRREELLSDWQTTYNRLCYTELFRMQSPLFKKVHHTTCLRKPQLGTKDNIYTFQHLYYFTSKQSNCNFVYIYWFPPNITPTSSPSVAPPKKYRTKPIQSVNFVMHIFRSSYLWSVVWPFANIDIFSVSPYQYFSHKNVPPVVPCSFNMCLHQNVAHVSCFLHPRNMSRNYNYTWQIKINLSCETVFIAPFSDTITCLNADHSIHLLSTLFTKKDKGECTKFSLTKEFTRITKVTRMMCRMEETNSLFQCNLLWQIFEARRRGNPITFTQTKLHCTINLRKCKHKGGSSLTP